MTKKVGQILSGKDLSESILTELAEKVRYEHEENFERKPKLVVVTIGEDPASKVYVRNKEKACEKVGINFENIKFLSTDTFSTISMSLYGLIQEKDLDGIIIQLPIVSEVLTKEEKEAICQLVPDEKDVDGFGVKSKLAVYEGCKDKEAFYPCTPAGVIKLLEKAESQIESIENKFKFKPFTGYQGLNALVIGRSDIVGKPVANMLMAKNMTVAIAHSKTPEEELRQYIRNSQVIVSAVGKILPVDNLEANALVIIDVGINRNSEGKLCGDLPEEWKAANSQFYTPVPGGVGPITVCMLMNNVVNAYLKNIKNFDKD